MNKQIDFGAFAREQKAQGSALTPTASGALTPNQIKHNLRRQGVTLKQWAATHGFAYRTVSDVVRGIRSDSLGYCVAGCHASATKRDTIMPLNVSRFKEILPETP